MELISIDPKHILDSAWLLIRSLFFIIAGLINKHQTWPLRININSKVESTFSYSSGEYCIEATVEFHPRHLPIVIKGVQLEIKDSRDKYNAIQIPNTSSYEELRHTVERKESFRLKRLAENNEGRIIVKANDNVCTSNWFPIYKTASP